MIGPGEKGSSFFLTEGKRITVIIKNSVNNSNNDYLPTIIMISIIIRSSELALVRYLHFVNLKNKVFFLHNVPAKFEKE